MSNLDSDCFTLRQGNAAREDHARPIEKLDLVKRQLARLPTRKDLARTALLISMGVAALAIIWRGALLHHRL
jgi:hypothetical protein